MFRTGHPPCSRRAGRSPTQTAQTCPCTGGHHWDRSWTAVLHASEPEQLPSCASWRSTPPSRRLAASLLSLPVAHVGWVVRNARCGCDACTGGFPCGAASHASAKTVVGRCRSTRTFAGGKSCGRGLFFSTLFPCSSGSAASICSWAAKQSSQLSTIMHLDVRVHAQLCASDAICSTARSSLSMHPLSAL